MAERSAASYLGPYGRVAYGFVNEKAHYTIEQRGAWITAWCMTGLRPGRDGTVKIRPLKAVIGAELLDFLIAEGDLEATDDQELLRFRNFEWANEPMERNRRNVAAYRERQKNDEQVGASSVDNLPSDNGNLTRDVVSTLLTSSKNVENDERRTELPIASDRDALDRYHELTGYRPWGRPAGSWITDLIETHGDVNVTAAIEVEHKADPSTKSLLGRVAARLERQKDRVEQAAKKERGRPKLTPDQEAFRAALVEREQAEPEAPEPTPEAIEAGRQAWAKLKGDLSNGSSHGPAQVLASGTAAGTVLGPGERRQARLDSSDSRTRLRSPGAANADRSPSSRPPNV